MLAGNAEARIHDKTAPKKPTKVTNKKTGEKHQNPTLQENKIKLLK
jgi:hypothetical protein